MGENFSEEMLVTKDFSNSQMDAFLQFFRDNQLKNVDLKAVLTPVTVHWNSMELYRELKKEHQERDSCPSSWQNHMCSKSFYVMDS